MRVSRNNAAQESQLLTSARLQSAGRKMRWLGQAYGQGAGSVRELGPMFSWSGSPASLSRVSPAPRAVSGSQEALDKFSLAEFVK